MRIVRWTKAGYEVGAEPRHCELALQQLELRGSKPLSSLGVEGKDEDDKEDDQLLSSEQTTRYRGIGKAQLYGGWPPGHPIQRQGGMP